VKRQPALAASVLLQDVSLTIGSPDGIVTSAQVSHAPVALGQPSAPQALALGTTSINVDLVAQGGLTNTYEVVIERGARLIRQPASNIALGAPTASSVARSGDTLAVGVYFDASAATGINANHTDIGAPGSGAVYVFHRTNSGWVQQAYIKASNTGAGDAFGYSVALSGDTLAVGAFSEDGDVTSRSGSPNDGASGAGAVYVFQRNGSTWSQQAYLKASNAGIDDSFGISVALSGDTLAVGAGGEASPATGVNGSQGDGAAAAGAVYVFHRANLTWTQQAYLKASNTGALDNFGGSVAIDGDTVAVGARNEASSAIGVNGNQGDGAPYAGAVYVFQRNNTSWSQQAYLKASNTGAMDDFGTSVAVSGDTLAVGADLEDSGATGINGNQLNEGSSDSGAVYIFQRTNGSWAQQAYVKASNTGPFDQFGFSVALDGNTLAVGASGESSGATGVNGNGADNSASQSGAAYVFQREGSTWTQQAYVKAANTQDTDFFGSSIAVFGGTLEIANGRGSIYQFQ